MPAKDSTRPYEYAGLNKTGVKKSPWLYKIEAEELRIRAFNERRPEAAFTPEALRKYLGMDH